VAAQKLLVGASAQLAIQSGIAKPINVSVDLPSLCGVPDRRGIILQCLLLRPDLPLLASGEP
jgi:hypothetical protein